MKTLQILFALFIAFLVNGCQTTGSVRSTIVVDGKQIVVQIEQRHDSIPLSKEAVAECIKNLEMLAQLHYSQSSEPFRFDNTLP